MYMLSSRSSLIVSCIFTGLSVFSVSGMAQASGSWEASTVTKDLLTQKYPGKTYSPYAERDFPMLPLDPGSSDE